LALDVQMHGYYGGIRLIKATIKRFVDYCNREGVELHGRNFSVRYETNIPQQVGLAGSSGIIVATLRCLMAFYDVHIPLNVQPSLVLSVETEELGITAGLQDRVIQCYEGIVYMDFAESEEETVADLKCYAYEPMYLDATPPFYVAYHAEFSEPTEVFHNDIRGRFDRGESLIVDAMQQFARYAEEGREALLACDYARLSQIIDANYDLRHSLYNLPPWQKQMVDIARACGASAKFAGSGGAIVGLYEGNAMLAEMRAKLGEIGTKVVVPQIVG
jgi:glucuronokinase